MTLARVLVGAAVVVIGAAAVSAAGGDEPEYVGDFPSIVAESGAAPSGGVTGPLPDVREPEPPDIPVDPVVPDAPPPDPGRPPGPPPVPPAPPYDEPPVAIPGSPGPRDPAPTLGGLFPDGFPTLEDLLPGVDDLCIVAGEVLGPLPCPDLPDPEVPVDPELPLDPPDVGLPTP